MIVSAVPGVRGHRVVDSDHWEAKVKLPLPTRAEHHDPIEIVDAGPASTRRCGRDGGGADVTSTFELRW